MKLTRDELKMKQAMPYDLKKYKFKKDIVKFSNEVSGNVYISFSGGKDSTIGLYIIMEMIKEGWLTKMPPIIFVNTGQEYKGIIDHVKNMTNKYNLEIEWIRPKIYETLKSKGLKPYDIWRYVGFPVASKSTSMAIQRYKSAKNIIKNEIEKARNGQNYNSDLIRDKRETMRSRLFGTKYKDCKNGNRGYTGVIPKKFRFLLKEDLKISEKCCSYLKKEPFATYTRKTGRYPINFTRVEESQDRLNKWLNYGCIKLGDNPQCKPMSIWTDDDIVLAEEEYKIDLPVEYTQMGMDRTGCRSCPFGVHLEVGENRFQKNAKYYPLEHEYDMEKLGMGKVLDLLGIAYK